MRIPFDTIGLCTLEHPRFDIAGAIFVSVWGLMFVGFALWMILRPDSYWAMWRRYLHNAKNASPNSLYYAKQDSIKRHVTTKHPERKAKIWGYSIIIVICLIEIVIWRVILYGPFG